MSTPVPVIPFPPAPRYSLLKGILKGAKAAAYVAVPIAAQVASAYLASPEHTAALLPSAWVGLAIPIAGLFEFLRNRNKHA